MEFWSFGDGCPIHDCTSIRDCIYVVDLAKGYIVVLKTFANLCGIAVYNM